MEEMCTAHVIPRVSRPHASRGRLNAIDPTHYSQSKTATTGERLKPEGKDIAERSTGDERLQVGYASPPSSPPGSMHECHSSSSAHLMPRFYAFLSARWKGESSSGNRLAGSACAVPSVRDFAPANHLRRLLAT